MTTRSCQYVMAHEIGHILSDHVLYKTMTVLLINLANMGFPIVGLAARAVLVGPARVVPEVRALVRPGGPCSAVQDPEVVMSARC